MLGNKTPRVLPVSRCETGIIKRKGPRKLQPPWYGFLQQESGTASLVQLQLWQYGAALPFTPSQLSAGCENSEAVAFNDPLAGELAEVLSLAVASA